MQELPECVGVTQPPLRGRKGLHEEGLTLSPARVEPEAGAWFRGVCLEQGSVPGNSKEAEGWWVRAGEKPTYKNKLSRPLLRATVQTPETTCIGDRAHPGSVLPNGEGRPSLWKAQGLPQCPSMESGCPAQPRLNRRFDPEESGARGDIFQAASERVRGAASISAGPSES